jgi:hypothetical protein
VWGEGELAVCGAKTVTTRMLLAGAEALSRMASVTHLAASTLFPPFASLRPITGLSPPASLCDRPLARTLSL